MLTLFWSSLSTKKPENVERADGRKKRKRRRKDGNKHRNRFLKLPDNIVVEIFCKIPIKTLFQCKCVCKSWHQSLSDPVFTKSLLSRAPVCLFLRDYRPPDPWPRMKHIMVDIRSVSFPNKMELKLSDPNALYNRFQSRIIGSCNGFLCISRFRDKIRTVFINLCNPITGECIPLPAYGTKSEPRYFGFGFNPITDVYKVVLFIVTNQYQKRNSKRGEGWKEMMEVMVLTVGSGIWRRIKGKVNDVEVDTQYGVFHNGFIHWICRSKRSSSPFIRTFDVETERFKDIPMPPYSFDNHCRPARFCIGVLKGSLSITISSVHTVISVWLMKEQGITKFWTKELEIGYFTDSNGQPYTTESMLVLKFLDEGKVLLSKNDGDLYIYTPSTRNLLRIKIAISWRVALSLVTSVHVPSFVSPKDILRNYISKHPEEKVETSSTIVVNEIKMPAWTTSVAGRGENEENELLEIPRGQSTPCLPLPEDLKYVSSSTATSLLDMISGLNALLSLKCMAGKDEIKRLREENEYLRAKSKLPMEWKMPVTMILCLIALILMPFMSYLILR